MGENNRWEETTGGKDYRGVGGVEQCTHSENVSCGTRKGDGQLQSTTFLVHAGCFLKALGYNIRPKFRTECNYKLVYWKLSNPQADNYILTVAQERKFVVHAEHSYTRTGLHMAKKTPYRATFMSAYV